MDSANYEVCVSGIQIPTILHFYFMRLKWYIASARQNIFQNDYKQKYINSFILIFFLCIWQSQICDQADEASSLDRINMTENQLEFDIWHWNVTKYSHRWTLNCEIDRNIDSNFVEEC